MGWKESGWFKYIVPPVTVWILGEIFDMDPVLGWISSLWKTYSGAVFEEIALPLIAFVITVIYIQWSQHKAKVIISDMEELIRAADVSHDHIIRQGRGATVPAGIDSEYEDAKAVHIALCNKYYRWGVIQEGFDRDGNTVGSLIPKYTAQRARDIRTRIKGHGYVRGSIMVWRMARYRKKLARKKYREARDN